MATLTSKLSSARVMAILLIMFGVASVLGVSKAKAWSLKEAAKPYAGTTINMICQAYTPCYAIEKLAPEFEEESGIKVVFELSDLDTIGRKALTDAVSGGGYYDIVEIQGPVNALWAEQDLSTPYDQFFNRKSK